MSTTTKHTPGPWEVRPTSNAKNGTRWRDIVSTGAPFAPSYVGEAIDTDARLIAQAPELLAAVEAMEAAARETGQNIPIELAPAWGRLWEAAQRAKGGGA